MNYDWRIHSIILLFIGGVTVVLLYFSNESIKFKNSIGQIEDCCKDLNGIIKSQKENYIA